MMTPIPFPGYSPPLEPGSLRLSDLTHLARYSPSFRKAGSPRTGNLSRRGQSGHGRAIDPALSGTIRCFAHPARRSRPAHRPDRAGRSGCGCRAGATVIAISGDPARVALARSAQTAMLTSACRREWRIDSSEVDAASRMSDLLARSRRRSAWEMKQRARPTIRACPCPTCPRSGPGAAPIAPRSPGAGGLHGGAGQRRRWCSASARPAPARPISRSPRRVALLQAGQRGPHRPLPPGGRGGGTARLPAGRHEGEGRSLSPPAVRRAERHDAGRSGDPQASANGEIEVAPLAFMRGRTLAHSFVILDEAQNTTPVQMKMFLTRMGEGTRMVDHRRSRARWTCPPGTGIGAAGTRWRPWKGLPGIAVFTPFDQRRRGSAPACRAPSSERLRPKRAAAEGEKLPARQEAPGPGSGTTEAASAAGGIGQVGR